MILIEHNHVHGFTLHSFVWFTMYISDATNPFWPQNTLEYLPHNKKNLHLRIKNKKIFFLVVLNTMNIYVSLINIGNKILKFIKIKIILVYW